MTFAQGAVGVAEVVCIDAGVWIKALVAEAGSDRAIRLVSEVSASSRIAAPAFCWAEVGSVLRKKVRSGDISADEGSEAWADFQAMHIDFVDNQAVHERAWSLAQRFAQPTLYDTAYLAVTELVEGATKHFWTADQQLLDALGADRPPYVHHLNEEPATA